MSHTWINKVPGFESRHQPGSLAEGVVSPCTGVCTLGPGNLCIGCLRSTDEIGNWLNYCSEDRKRIMEQLPNRLATLFAL